MKACRNLGNTIQYLLEKKGITAEKMAAILNCSIEDLKMGLAGRKIFSFIQLEQIANELGISVGDLLSSKQNEYYVYAMDCMNEFSNEKYREEILDIIYDYLDVYDSVHNKED